mgnify:CR=1 FL=1
MQPTQLSAEIAQSIKSFVTTGFNTDTPYFKGMFERFVDEPGALVKGPWLSMGLPFQQGTDGRNFFAGFTTQSPPYMHQQQAWQRIASDKMAQSTLVATGTGSGKTECFLYPLLDHCVRHPQKGVKAIVIYPMNALATDQAKRFAKEIHQTSQLKGKVRVGLFVGGKEDLPSKTMSADSVITDKDVLRSDPPDILLTNYKMLDFLLLRPKDQQLWRHNGPDTLRYIVVDELHTFDGAQGTDLACLIRRLKGRLLDPDKSQPLIAVGTSATLGGGNGAAALTEYAKQVFRSEFDQHSVITEQRQGLDQFLSEPIDFFWQPLAQWEPVEGIDEWKQFFFPGQSELTPQQLGHSLKRLLLFNNLLKLLAKAPLSLLDDLTHELASRTPEGVLRDHTAEILQGLCQLVAVAKDDHGQPLVNLRLQLWMREMKRMVTPLQLTPPQLTYADDLQIKEDALSLPLVQCNHCNATAWLSKQDQGDSCVSSDLRKIYQAWFAHDPDAVILYPVVEGEVLPEHAGFAKHLCTSCGYIQESEGDCSGCGEAVQKVFKPVLQRTRSISGVNHVVTEHNCAMCGVDDSVMVFGAQSATMASVMIHQLYASPNNDDKKLITFSDSVQDAAHRAGFFAARTWQNLVRQAMVQALPDGDIGLEAFYERLPQYWLDNTINSAAMNEERFVAEFIAPNMVWYQDYEQLIKSEHHKLVSGSTLVTEVSRRLGWEVFAEFGYRSRVGRSVEQTGSAAIGIFQEPIDKTVAALCEYLVEEEGLRHVTTDMVSHFVTGLLLYMKQHGAIDHPSAATYITQGGQNFLLSRLSYLPNFARFGRSPVYLTDATGHGRFESILQKTKSSWVASWLLKTLARNDLIPNGIERSVLNQTIFLLKREHLIREYDDVKERLVWALNPAQLYVSRDVVVLETDNARDRLFVARSFAPRVEGMASLLTSDRGAYAVADSRASWLSSLYEQGDIKRINAKEHTGLLARDDRQAIEKDFMTGKQPWSCNLLSATPTLEMGIDIGDLSSLLLCSVPPAQANYLQRIGRAGRRDGNAFAMTVAEGSPHDLYFYADPMLMMAGDVEPPGIFLNAFAVISRQLTAYCMDRWVQSGIQDSAIPKKMKPVLDGVGLGAVDQFPRNFTGFVNQQALVLLEGFLHLFDGELSQTTCDRLRDFITGQGDEDGLEMRLSKRLWELYEERNNFQTKIKDLKNALTRLQKLPSDEATDIEIDAVEQERSSLQSMLSSLHGRQPLNYLTDEGLLPNYAFPEEGVTLRSVIYRKRAEGQSGEGKYINDVYEYERPSAAAIRELMPKSRFFAGERKVEIEQVDLELSSIEKWRFCPSCTHSEQESSDALHSDCPKCGDEMWADGGQLIEMVRLRQVMANTDDKNSRIGDDSDTRDPSFHVKQMLADFDSQSVKQAFRIQGDDVPFGFEFINKVAFREINFGEYGATGEEQSIAGIAEVRPGFKLCRQCGMVQDTKRFADGGQKHSYTCSARNSKDDNEDSLIECLYLYREFGSEALRILLPSSDMDDGDCSINSFIAGLQLGLKIKFGGKVDHLRVMSYSAPGTDTLAERKFLMIYDSVPGGTGYLQQLMEPTTPDDTSTIPMLQVFEMARDRMVHCDCNQDETKDGCYSCLYAYRNSHGMEGTSRDRSVQLFNRILAKRDEIESLTTIDDIEVNPLLESELEIRFIGAIRTAQESGLDIQIQQQMVNGKPGYFLRVNESLYTIEPQVNVSSSDGVMVASKPDFLIRSAQASGKGAGFLPIALFLDGFKYHKDITAEDSAKRLAIVQSKRYRVWALTWDDVRNQYAKTRVELGNPFTIGLNESMVAVQKSTMKALGLEAEFFKLPLKNPFSQLLHFLAEPNADKMAGLMLARLLSWFDQSKMSAIDHIKATQNRIEGVAPGAYMPILEAMPKQLLCGGMHYQQIRVDCLMPPQALSELAPQKALVSVMLDDQFKADESISKSVWHGYLSLFNLLQFLPLTLITTRTGISAGLYESIKWGSDEPVNTSAAAVDVALQEVMSEVSDSFRTGLIRLNDLHCEVPEVGYELMNSDGEVVGDAIELAWLDLLVLGIVEGADTPVLPDGESWHIVVLDEQGQWADTVASLVKGEN